jgi:hypothetical protein
MQRYARTPAGALSYCEVTITFIVLKGMGLSFFLDIRSDALPQIRRGFQFGQPALEQGAEGEFFGGTGLSGRGGAWLFDYKGEVGGLGFILLLKQIFHVA